MKCTRVQDRLLLYLAAELSPRETAGIINHVARCADCTAVAEELARTQERLVAALQTKIDAPTSLDARVMAALRELPVNQPLFNGFRPHVRRPLVYAASLCFVIFIVLAGTIWGRSVSAASLSMATLGEAHNRLITTESADQFQRLDPNQLARQLTAIMKFPVRASDLTSEGAQLIGGNRITVENTSIAELRYRWQGNQVSLFEMGSSRRTPAELRQLGHEADAYYAHKAGDMVYVAWHVGETECIMVARSVHMHELFHLACRACEQQEINVVWSRNWPRADNMEY
jgi:anti-sigma factor RsiW